MKEKQTKADSMWREWLGIIAVFASVLMILSVVSPGVSTAQPTGSTSLNPPPTGITPKSMQCYGAGTTSGSIYSASNHVCGPGSKDYDNDSDCNSGDVAVGANYNASLWDPSMYCHTRCQSIDFPQSNCQWR